jgi:K+-sensing histidine kinase KdpD
MLAMVTLLPESELTNRLGAFLSALPSDPTALFEREFGTPLNALVTSTAVLAEDMSAITQEQARERVAALHRRALLLHLVAEDVFCAAAIAENRFELHRQEIHLSEMLAEASTAASPLLRHKGLRLETSGDASSSLIFIDARRVGQVLLTLIHAIGEVAADGSAVEISARAQHRTVHVEVSTGVPGAPPRLLTLPPEASGLAIGVARSIVDAHGGAFGEADRARYWFELPLP